MKNLKSLLFVGFLFYTSKVCLYGAVFELPAGTPGLQAPQLNASLVHVIIPGTNIDLCFPRDGSQPTTERAGLWSGARHVGEPNDNLVTDWWVRVFGGNRAVNAFHGNGGIPPLPEPQMVRKRHHKKHVIHVNTNVQGTPQNFEQQFWQAFREIAADPVGRVLLYRLLIEIRRVNDTGHGYCGNDVILGDRHHQNDRNARRNIEIINSNKGCVFVPFRRLIAFDLNPDIQTGILMRDLNGNLTTQGETRPCSIALFHEILHWFHLLRNPSRFVELCSKEPCSFKYPLRCYYGNVGELSVWGGCLNAEEIATILGSPNSGMHNNLLALIPRDAFPLRRTAANDFQVNIHGVNQYIPISEKYLNGDDLSENAYRASRGQHMRFGHMTTAIEPVLLNPLPGRFQLAHGVAVQCYRDITGNTPQNWQLIPGQAIRP